MSFDGAKTIEFSDGSRAIIHKDDTQEIRPGKSENNGVAGDSASVNIADSFVIDALSKRDRLSDFKKQMEKE